MNLPLFDVPHSCAIMRPSRDGVQNSPLKRLCGNDGFIGCVICMLQVQQTCNKARRQGWATTFGCEVNTKLSLNACPVDQPSQSDELMAHIELAIKPGTKEFLRSCSHCFWAH
jgi:hypothetical protein